MRVDIPVVHMRVYEISFGIHLSIIQNYAFGVKLRAMM